MKIFLFFAITFQPIITKTCEAPLNDRQNLSFVKDKHSYGEKMARKAHKKAFYKVYFISEHTLAQRVTFPHSFFLHVRKLKISIFLRIFHVSRFKTIKKHIFIIQSCRMLFFFLPELFFFD